MGKPLSNATRGKSEKARTGEYNEMDKTIKRFKRKKAQEKMGSTTKYGCMPQTRNAADK